MHHCPQRQPCSLQWQGALEPRSYRPHDDTSGADTEIPDLGPGFSRALGQFFDFAAGNAI
jgi:hypothetical protein